MSRNSTETRERNFEEWLKLYPDDMRMALIDVCDTGEMCQRWLESRGLSYTAADVLSMVRMVLDREAIRKKEESWQSECSKSRLAWFFEARPSCSHRARPSCSHCL